MEPNIARKAFLVYFGISLAVALVFLLFTFVTGKDYSTAARYGGAGWVLFLSLLVTMPLVIPAVKRRAQRGP